MSDGRLLLTALLDEAWRSCSFVQRVGDDSLWDTLQYTLAGTVFTPQTWDSFAGHRGKALPSVAPAGGCGLLAVLALVITVVKWQKQAQEIQGNWTHEEVDSVCFFRIYLDTV